MYAIHSVLAGLLAGSASMSALEVKSEVGRSGEDGIFQSKGIPSPATNDAATSANFKLLSGMADPNGASLDVLHDGRIPRSEDDPRSNFFFAGGSNGGRILVDLGKVIDVSSIATYSWHPGSRAAQKYQVYVADGSAEGFSAELKEDADPTKAGWEKLGEVDTSGEQPGQHAARLSPAKGKSLGKCRWVLFEVRKNPNAGPFNDTFFSEIDIIDAAGPELVRIERPKKVIRQFGSKHGNFRYTLDVSAAPDLEEWCAEHLIPVMDEWYPKIIEMLPVEGITAAESITFTLRNPADLPQNLRGVPAYASGNSVVFNADFMRRQQTGEAIGAGVHEVVHVVQFGGTREKSARQRGRANRPPSWVTEGVADYIRWFLYEPQSKGAEITRRNFDRANYDGSYRITANFFDWVIRNHEKDLMRKLNVATHDGYSDDLWKEWTGKTVQELNDGWKAYHKKKLGL
ncbi:conserved hypothetical protein [Haloferula helveola]|uniref:Plant Basic Secretory Protein n=1 Tax=Haloferula helveola TaxID=490095 RepID=A0ABM7RM26_9BACT|nr:conserved hypothetical protein [Haloferula helveola]